MQYFRKIWRDFGRPSVHYGIGTLILGGFIAGVIFWGGINTALEATNTEGFCISCHEHKDNVYQEMQMDLFLQVIVQIGIIIIGYHVIGQLIVGIQDI